MSNAVNGDHRTSAAIFDVDGTLCDVRTIRHYVERTSGQGRSRRDFARFHTESEFCPPFPEVLNLLRSLTRDGYAILVVTGREARWRALTERWLALHSINYDQLWTRGESDYRPDATVKAEMLASLTEQWRVALAVDDRPDILAVWASAAIPTVAVSGTGNLTDLEGVKDPGLFELIQTARNRDST